MAYHTRGSWNNVSTKMENVKHGVNINVYNFQAAVKKLLNKQEQKDITNILQNYNRNRNAYYLAESIKPLLNTNEKKCIVLLLKQIIPKADRPTFDQFTCEETYQSRALHSRDSSMSHVCTNDSGIGINNNEQDFTSKASDFGSYSQGRHSNQTPRRSSSLSDLSGKRNKNGKAFAGTFGSAVRRKVRAVLARRGSSSNIELKSSMHRKYSSETKLNKLGQTHDAKYTNSTSRETAKIRKASHESSCDLVRINLKRGRNKEFGFTIGGGSEVGSGIYVTAVESGSPAETAGLSTGDVIVKVNEMPFNAGVSHDTAVAVLSTLDNLVMSVKPCKASERGSCDIPWVDVNGRPSSPPRTTLKKKQFPEPVLDSRRSSVHLMQAGERKVNLTVKPRQRLGLMIRGGSEYGLGIYVTGVDRMSAADTAGLRIGDEILEVNNLRLEGVTHAEAVNAIKSSPMLIMIVRYVGKVPQNQSTSTNDDRVSLQSNSVRKLNHGIMKENRNGVRATFQRKLPNGKHMILPNKSPVHQSALKVSSTMSILEDVLLSSPVWMLLTDFERRSVRYYVKEYASENVSTNELVMALAELLNTSEKLTLMTSIRECIDPRDLDRFDVLLLRKEVESLRNLQGSQTSRNGSFVSLEVSSHPSEDQSLISASSDAEVQTSTPRLLDSESKLQESVESPTVSPVRPTSKPPPPPTEKHPPAKPKRSCSQNRRSVLESVSSSATEDDSPNKDMSTGDKKRPSSPFSFAIENHRSSHSGRVKVGNKTSHPPLPSSEFFQGPQNEEKPSVVEPVYSSIIKPVKNPASDLIKARRSSWRRSSTRNVPAGSNINASTSSTTSVSSSSSVGEPHNLAPHPPPQKITLRPANFASAVHNKVTQGHAKQQPVKVDVHREPSVKKTIQKYNNQDKSHDSASSLEQQNSFANDESSIEDEEQLPFMSDDVEKQKVVVFRRANALGLVVEGGAGTKQPLPRVLRIQHGSCAHLCGRIQAGHVIHEVNGNSLAGLDHHSAVRAIALAFKQEDRDSIEFVLSGPY